MRRLVVVVLPALSASGLACNQGGRPFRRQVRQLHPRSAHVNLDSEISQVARSALSKRLGIRWQDRKRGAEQEHARLAGVDSTEVAAQRAT